MKLPQTRAAIALTDDTVMGATLVDPGSARRPGLLILHEIFGVNHAMQAEAQLWGQQGFLALVPDLFHRLEPDVELDYTPEGRAHGFSLWERLDESQALADARAAALWLRAHPRCNGTVAGLGFCLGGRLVVLIGDALDRLVSFYPVKLQEQRGACQVLRTPAMIQLGADDSHVPPEVIAMIEDDIGTKPQHRVIVHSQAGHGFYNAHRHPGYAPEPAARAFDQAKAFLTNTNP
jgi:carboxymethylenebutenolidase